MSQLARKVFKNPIYFLAFGFGSGLMPRAPGTWGTIAALPLYYLLSYASPLLYLLITFLVCVAGIYICHYVAKDLGEHDYPGIVWDEIAGYLCTMFLAPAGFIWMALGFGLFRLFDIWKPFPITWADAHVKGGLGIMLDDLLAAVPAWVILQLLAWRFA
jgi:phosphatidylglycerophosphatase A